MAIDTELIKGFEGYGPVEKNSTTWQIIPGITQYGYFPIKDMFSVVYRIKEKTDNKEIAFSFFIDKNDAIALEFVLKREIIQRSMRSETYYCKTVFMTCISGSYPLISFPYRGFSIRLYNDKDYNNLLEMVTDFLDTQDLNEEQKEFREELRRQLDVIKK